jgi:hypothetical protein
MPPKKNPLKLNKLQLRTLTLAQLIAQEPNLSRSDEATGETTLLHLPHAHGDHVHIGRYTVSTRDASGLGNPSVWSALVRKGLARIEPSLQQIVLTADGLSYDTGLGHHLAAPSDH